MPDRVTDACEACYDAHTGDCSGFVKAVAATLDVTVEGNADQMVDILRSGEGGWTVVTGGPAAAAAAAAGKLVVGGLKGAEQTTPNPHGHVVVVVPGPLARNAYPTAWWGSLGGQPGKNQTINYAWVAGDRDRVSYAAHDIAV